MRNKPGLIATAFLAVLFLAGNANASLLTIDEYLFEGDLFDAVIVKGSIDATVSGNVLTLVVKNTMTSQVSGGAGSGNLLTGLGLTLPNGVKITGGTVFAVPTSNNNFSVPGGWNGNISMEWGYLQPPMGTHGHLESPGTLTYGLGIGTVTSDIGNDNDGLPPHLGSAFATGSIGNPQGYDGPDFGVYSTALGMGKPSAGGQKSVGDYITIALALDTQITDAGAFINGINSNAVALMFASPTNAFVFVPDTQTSTPEPTSFMLAGMGLCGVIGVARRRRKQEQV